MTHNPINGLHQENKLTHKKLTELPAEQLQKEIRDSKTKIEEITGSEVKFFS